MADPIQAVLPRKVVHAIGYLIGANSKKDHDTSKGPLGRVCVVGWMTTPFASAAPMATP